jgi:ligand-binding sensor domain-containing protein
MRHFLQQLFLCCFGLFGLSSQAADYQFLQYRVENGLQTDIIKCIEQDSLGFIWIGSDEGVMQYNGNRFMHYPNASSSPFIKDFLKLRNGRLLVLHDLGLNEIINQVDTVIFKQILPGTRMPTDSSIWYAKSLFEDSQGNIWISEPQSV